MKKRNYFKIILALCCMIVFLNQSDLRACHIFGATDLQFTESPPGSGLYDVSFEYFAAPGESCYLYTEVHVVEAGCPPAACVEYTVASACIDANSGGGFPGDGSQTVRPITGLPLCPGKGYDVVFMYRRSDSPTCLPGDNRPDFILNGPGTSGTPFEPDCFINGTCNWTGTADFNWASLTTSVQPSPADLVWDLTVDIEFDDACTAPAPYNYDQDNTTVAATPVDSDTAPAATLRCGSPFTLSWESDNACGNPGNPGNTYEVLTANTSANMAGFDASSYTDVAECANGVIPNDGRFETDEFEDQGFACGDGDIVLNFQNAACNALANVVRVEVIQPVQVLYPTSDFDAPLTINCSDACGQDLIIAGDEWNGMGIDMGGTTSIEEFIDNGAGGNAFSGAWSGQICAVVSAADCDGTQNSVTVDECAACGVYEIEYAITNANCAGCSTTTTRQVSVVSPRVENPAADVTSICGDYTFTLIADVFECDPASGAPTAVDYTGAGTLIWGRDDGGADDDFLVAQPAAPGTCVTVNFTPRWEFAGCTDCNDIGDPIAVEVCSAPDAPDVDNIIGCYGELPPPFNATGNSVTPTAPPTFDWYDADPTTGAASIFTGNPFSSPEILTGTYEYWVTETDANGCTSTATRVELTILPEISVTLEKIQCDGDPDDNACVDDDVDEYTYFITVVLGAPIGGANITVDLPDGQTATIATNSNDIVYVFASDINYPMADDISLLPTVVTTSGTLAATVSFLGLDCEATYNMPEQDECSCLNQFCDDVTSTSGLIALPTGANNTAPYEVVYFLTGPNGGGIIQSDLTDPMDIDFDISAIPNTGQLCEVWSVSYDTSDPNAQALIDGALSIESLLYPDACTCLDVSCSACYIEKLPDPEPPVMTSDCVCRAPDGSFGVAGNGGLTATCQVCPDDACGNTLISTAVTWYQYVAATDDTLTVANAPTASAAAFDPSDGQYGLTLVDGPNTFFASCTCEGLAQAPGQACEGEFASVIFTVVPTPDAPVIEGDEICQDEAIPTFTYPSSNVDGSVFAFSLVSDPVNGVLANPTPVQGVVTPAGPAPAPPFPALGTGEAFVPGGGTVAFQPDVATDLQNLTPGDYVFQITETTGFDVTGLNSCVCTSAAGTFTLTIFEDPDATITETCATVCTDGFPIQLGALFFNGLVIDPTSEVEWFATDATYDGQGQPNLGPGPLPNGTFDPASYAPGTYYFYLSITTEDGCNSTSNLALPVTVVQGTNAQWINPGPRCGGDEIDFTAYNEEPTPAGVYEYWVQYPPNAAFDATVDDTVDPPVVAGGSGTIIFDSTVDGPTFDPYQLPNPTNGICEFYTYERILVSSITVTGEGFGDVDNDTATPPAGTGNDLACLQSCTTRWLNTFEICPRVEADWNAGFICCDSDIIFLPGGGALNIAEAEAIIAANAGVGAAGLLNDMTDPAGTAFINGATYPEEITLAGGVAAVTGTNMAGNPSGVWSGDGVYYVDIDGDFTTNDGFYFFDPNVTTNNTPNNHPDFTTAQGSPVLTTGEITVHYEVGSQPCQTTYTQDFYISCNAEADLNNTEVCTTTSANFNLQALLTPTTTGSGVWSLVNTITDNTDNVAIGGSVLTYDPVTDPTFISLVAYEVGVLYVNTTGGYQSSTAGSVLLTDADNDGVVSLAEIIAVFGTDPATLTTVEEVMQFIIDFEAFFALNGNSCFDVDYAAVKVKTDTGLEVFEIIAEVCENPEAPVVNPIPLDFPDALVGDLNNCIDFSNPDGAVNTDISGVVTWTVTTTGTPAVVLAPTDATTGDSSFPIPDVDEPTTYTICVTIDPAVYCGLPVCRDITVYPELNATLEPAEICMDAGIDIIELSDYVGVDLSTPNNNVGGDGMFDADDTAGEGRPTDTGGVFTINSISLAGASVLIHQDSLLVWDPSTITEDVTVNITYTVGYEPVGSTCTSTDTEDFIIRYTPTITAQDIEVCGGNGLTYDVATLAGLAEVNGFGANYVIDNIVLSTATDFTQTGAAIGDDGDFDVPTNPLAGEAYENLTTLVQTVTYTITTFNDENGDDDDDDTGIEAANECTGNTIDIVVTVFPIVDATIIASETCMTDGTEVVELSDYLSVDLASDNNDVGGGGMFDLDDLDGNGLPTTIGGVFTINSVSNAGAAVLIYNDTNLAWDPATITEDVTVSITYTIGNQASCAGSNEVGACTDDTSDDCYGTATADFIIRYTPTLTTIEPIEVCGDGSVVSQVDFGIILTEINGFANTVYTITNTVDAGGVETTAPVTPQIVGITNIADYTNPTGVVQTVTYTIVPHNDEDGDLLDDDTLIESENECTGQPIEVTVIVYPQVIADIISEARCQGDVNGYFDLTEMYIDADNATSAPAANADGFNGDGGNGVGFTSLGGEFTIVDSATGLLPVGIIQEGSVITFTPSIDFPLVLEVTYTVGNAGVGGSCFDTDTELLVIENPELAYGSASVCLEGQDGFTLNPTLTGVFFNTATGATCDYGTTEGATASDAGTLNPEDPTGVTAEFEIIGVTYTGDAEASLVNETFTANSASIQVGNEFTLNQATGAVTYNPTTGPIPGVATITVQYTSCYGCVTTFDVVVNFNDGVSVVDGDDRNFCLSDSNIDFSTFFSSPATNLVAGDDDNGEYFLNGEQYFGSDLVIDASLIGNHTITYCAGLDLFDGTATIIYAADGETVDGFDYNNDGIVDLDIDTATSNCTGCATVSIDICPDMDPGWNTPAFLCEDGFSPALADQDDADAGAGLYELIADVVAAGDVAGTDYSYYTWSIEDAISTGNPLFTDADGTTNYNVGDELTGASIWFDPTGLSDESEIEICLTVHSVGALEDANGVDLCASCVQTYCYEIPVVSDYEAGLFTGYNQTWCIEDFRDTYGVGDPGVQGTGADSEGYIDLTQLLDSGITPGDGYFTVTFEDGVEAGQCYDATETTNNPTFAEPSIYGCLDGFLWYTDSLTVGSYTIRYTVEGSGQCARYDEVVITLEEPIADCFAPPALVCEGGGNNAGNTYNLNDWMLETCAPCLDTIEAVVYTDLGAGEMLPFDYGNLVVPPVADATATATNSTPTGTQTVSILPNPVIPDGGTLIGMEVAVGYFPTADNAEGDLDYAAVTWGNSGEIIDGIEFLNDAGPLGGNDHFFWTPVQTIDYSDDLLASEDLYGFIGCNPTPITFTLESNSANFTIGLYVKYIFNTCEFSAVLNESVNNNGVDIDAVPLPYDSNGDGDYDDQGDIPGGVYYDEATASYYFDANGLNAIDAGVNITIDRAGCGNCGNSNTQTILVVEDYLAEFTNETENLCADAGIIDLTQYLSINSDNGGNFSSSDLVVNGDIIDVSTLTPGDYVIMYDVADGVNTCGQSTDMLTITIDEALDPTGVSFAPFYCEGDDITMPTATDGTAGTWTFLAPDGTMQSYDSGEVFNTAGYSVTNPIQATFTVGEVPCERSEDYLIVVESSYDAVLAADVQACESALADALIMSSNGTINMDQFVLPTPAFGAGYWELTSATGSLAGTLFTNEGVGTYTFTFTVPGSGDCGAVRPFSITIDPEEDATFTLASILCSEDTYNLSDAANLVQTIDATICISGNDVATSIANPSYGVVGNASIALPVPTGAKVLGLTVDYNYVGFGSANGDLDMLAITLNGDTANPIASLGNGDGPNGDNHFEFDEIEDIVYPEGDAILAGITGCANNSIDLAVLSNSAQWDACMTVSMSYTTGTFTAALPNGESLESYGYADPIIYSEDGTGTYTLDVSDLCGLNEIAVTFERFGCSACGNNTSTEVVQVVCGGNASLAEDVTVCYEESIDLTQYFTTETSPNGVFSGANVLGANLTPSVTGGAYEVVYTQGVVGSECGATDTIMVTVEPMLDASFDVDLTFCGLDDASWDLPAAADNGSYAVSSTGDVATIDGSTLNGNGYTGLVEITYTVTAGACTESETQIASIVNTVAGDLADVTVCYDNDIDLTQLFAEGTTYGGSFTGTYGEAGIAAPIAGYSLYPSADGGVYAIEYTVGNAASSCGEATGMATLTVLPSVDAEWDGPSSFCAATESYDLTNYFTNTTETGGTWVVTSGGGSISGGMYSADGYTGFVIIEYTVENGACSESHEEVIQVLGDLDATFDIAPTACVGQVITPTANTAGGVWSGMGVDPDTGAFTASMTGVFVITYEVGDDACDNVYSKAITVYDVPNAPTVSEESLTICEGEDLSSVTIAGDFFDYYVVTIGGVEVASGAPFYGNEMTLDVASLLAEDFTGSTTLMIASANQGGCMSDAVELTVTVNAITDIAYEIGCTDPQSGLAALTVQGLEQPFTIAVHPQGTTPTIMDYNPENDPLAIIEAGVPYDITVEDANGCPAILEGVIARPALDYTASISCTDDNGMVIVSVTVDENTGYGSPYQYSYNGGISYVNESSVELSAAANPTISILIRDSKGCLSAFETFTIGDGGALAPTATCADENGMVMVDLGFAGSNFAASYTYNGATNQIGGASSFPLTVTTEGLVTISVTDLSGSVACDLEGTVMVYPTLTVTATPDLEGCPQGSASTDIETTGGNAPFSLMVDGEAVGSFSLVSVQELAAGTHSIMITDATGCTASTEVVIPEGVEIATPDLVYDSSLSSATSVCGAAELTLTVTGGTTYAWTIDNVAQTETGNSLTASFNGPAMVTATVVDGECTGDALEIPITYYQELANTTPVVTCNGDDTYTVNFAISGGNIAAPYFVEANGNGVIIENFGTISATYSLGTPFSFEIISPESGCSLMVDGVDECADPQAGQGCNPTLAQGSLDCESGQVTVFVSNAGPDFEVTGISGGASFVESVIDGFGGVQVTFSLDDSNVGNFTMDYMPGGVQCGGALSFDISVDCSNVTAIELLRFDGEVLAEGNNLFWATASETNSDFFTVERSIDGSLFKSVGTISAKGNSTTEATYNLLDVAAPNGISYYRLLETDVDGVTRLVSQVVELTRTSGINVVEVYPVPTSDVVNIDLTLVDAAQLITTVYDITGKTVNVINTDGVAGINQLQIDVANYAAGTYFVTINNGISIENTKFIKK